MPVIWGLDLREIKGSKFKSSWMFARTWHLRRTKMIIYQCAMILCVCSESVGTAALTDYLDQQDFVERLSGHIAALYNDNFVGIASYNIFVGVTVAIIFGAAFFFDLFWPERHESRAVRLAWKICAVLISIMCFADVLAMTIIVATQKATISGIDAKEAQHLLEVSYKHPNLYYRDNPKAIASVVLLWPGFIATVAATCVLIVSQNHDDKYGPLSTTGKAQREYAEKERNGIGNNDDIPKPDPVNAPEPARVRYESA